MNRKLVKKIIRTVFFLILIMLMLFPLLIMLNTSLQEYENIRIWPPSWFRSPLQWKNYYIVIIGEKSIIPAFLNTLQISSITMILCVFIGVLAGYGVTRFNFKGKKTYLLVIMITQMFSSVLLINPMYVIFRNLGLLDTKLSLIIADTTTALPMTIWLLYSYFSQIPIEYEEASWMDGSSRLEGIFNIVFPLAIPGIITAGLFAFLTSWGNMLFAKTFITSPELRTVSLALTNFQELYKTTWETQMAASFITMIPPFLIFLFIQNKLVEGLASDGVKG